MRLIFVPVPPDGDVHILGGVLRGAGAETVEAEGVFIVAAVVVFVLAAGVQLTVDKLPVEALFRRVPVHGTAAAEILYLNGLVLIICQRYEIAVALARLVDGVGEDLKGGVLAAVYPVRAENDAGALADSVRALEGDYAFVAVLCGAFCSCFLTFQPILAGHGGDLCSTCPHGADRRAFALRCGRIKTHFNLNV